MTPAHAQAQVDVFVRAGTPLTDTAIEPGVHGAAVTGMHGCGVNTPRAAAVAAITCGLLGLMHIPNGGMFTLGAKSATVHAGVVAVAGFGVAETAAGATPNEHAIWDPVVTRIGMLGTP
jgi:hypothetical protein